MRGCSNYTALLQVTGAVLHSRNPSLSNIIVGETSVLQSWFWRSKKTDSYCSYIISLFIHQSSRSRTSDGQILTTEKTFWVDIRLSSYQFKGYKPLAKEFQNI